MSEFARWKRQGETTALTLWTSTNPIKGDGVGGAVRLRGGASRVVTGPIFIDTSSDSMDAQESAPIKIKTGDIKSSHKGFSGDIFIVTGNTTHGEHGNSLRSTKSLRVD